MNYRFIFLVIGIVELFIGAAMSISSIFGFYYGDETPHILLINGFVVFLVGLFLYLTFRNCDKAANNKTAVLLVILTWLAMCASGATPFYFAKIFGSHSPHAFLNSIFESTSGFTTTGASVLGNPYPIESVGHGLLFWRSFTHWIGGIGVILMVISIFPLVGSAGMQLFKTEAPGVVMSKIQPRMVSTARALGLVYFILTAVLVVLYLFGGMSLFDAICTAFGAIATGGFSTKDASIAAFHSPYIEWVTIIFLFIGATNFSLHYAMMKGNPKKYLKSSEFKFYFLWIVGSTALAIGMILMAGVMKNLFSSTHDLIRSVAFQVTSISTATGYVTRDYNLWPWGVKALLLLLMIFGGCVGSTAGGVKMFRLMILVKFASREIKRVLHQGLFTAVKFDKEVVQRGVLEGICSFFILYMMIMIIATLIVSSTGMNITDSLSAVITTMGGVGPGLGSVGPVSNFYFVHPVAKMVLILCMLFGRLEIIPFVALFTPTLWKK